MHYRYERIVIFILIMVSSVSLTFALSTSNLSTQDLALNFGTEVLGILFTVGIIQYLLDKQNKQVEWKKISWELLHDLDHAVWVWLGGTREFDIHELFSLLRQANKGDPLPVFTEALFLKIGSRADNILRERDDIIKGNYDLISMLKSLKELSKIRDENIVNKKVLIIGVCEHSIDQLLNILRHRAVSPFGASIEKSSAIEDQKSRHFGND